MAEKVIKPILRETFRLILAGVFIYAGLVKVSEPATFITDIQNYKITSYAVSFCLAFFLPWLEITSALSLYLRKYRKSGALIILLMLVVFLVAIVSAWARDLNITCGCFGGGEKVSYTELIVRDGVLMLMMLFVYWSDSKSKAK